MNSDKIAEELLKMADELGTTLTPSDRKDRHKAMNKFFDGFHSCYVNGLITEQEYQKVKKILWKEVQDRYKNDISVI
jgi:hypothetical protein